ncbi:two-component system LytT family sensor kinase [Chryseobacterium sp. H1D6B]|uniref:sensor histidine kinase n=1 Tax=Chryseobacterium sp. H1D6B TaxID=2940588 RepID=UPI0015C69B39|nr:histidine kinase [Chryseobacterium sp. H1D6B]MDH6254233.1 two-component system LytT family sensor kinase [Chryseobacterium sp. H1D6B]
MKYNSQGLKDILVIDFLVEDRYRFWRHLAFLIFFFCLIYNARFWHSFTGDYQYYALFYVYTCLLVMAYINIYILVPFLFFKTHYISYIIVLVLLGTGGLNCIGYGFNHFFLQHRIGEFPKESNKGLYEGAMMCISIILTTTTVKLLQKWTKDNKRIAELNNLTLNMELNELRNQINPHFLFNMLNNVKALIRTDPEKATTVIIKLSEFLRYQLYENGEEKTLLTSEIDFLSNFLNLEKIRRENFIFEIKSDTDKRILNGVFIPPNLFTTFVENAVKHSVDISDKESYVKVNIEIEGQKLYFTCCNSRNPDYPVSNTNYSGLGLANIKRRLELLFNDTHHLEITSKEKEYIINLIIPV